MARAPLLHLSILALLAACSDKDLDTGPAEPEPPRTRTAEVDVTISPIKDPLWRPADFVIFSAGVGEFRQASRVTGCLHDPLEHAFDVNNSVYLPVVEGPHDIPYDTELSEAVLRCGWESSRLLEPEDLYDGQDPTATTPSTAGTDDYVEVGSATFFGFTLVPVDGGPLGRTIDFDEGPLITESSFPIEADLDFLRATPTDPEGELVDYKRDQIHPRMVDLAVPGMGLSHVPWLFMETSSLLPPDIDTAGVFRWKVSLRDARGTGYDLTADMYMGEDAAGGPGYGE